MTLDGAGLGLAIFAELRTILRSIQERKSCYKEAPALFAHIENTLSRLTALVDDISTTAGANPDALPHALQEGFIETLSTVKEAILHAESTVKDYCESPSPENSSCNCFPSVTSKCRRFLKSKTLKASMTNIQRKASEAEGKLQHLRTQLCTGLKVDNLRGVIEKHVVPGDTFRPAFNAPMIAGNTHLDFDTKDADGKFCAPEGSLKSSVFISTSPKQVTVARGASRPTTKPCPVHGVSGMAGVGKTTALIGLGHDDDIKTHFADGVLYMSVGANATLGHLITELWKLLSVTGAKKGAEAVQSSKSLADAIAIASVWFHGRRILFLIDDIWPTSTCPEGYLPDLEGLLQGSPESRMAISTRSFDIASKRGSHVDFGARDPCGPTSLAIFLSHAQPGAPLNDRLLDAARSVLHLCAGLPISLSIAGAAVSRCADAEDDFEDACQTYLQNIRVEISFHPGTSFLENAIRFSLLALSKEGVEKGQAVYEATGYSFSELYESLCVLENQQFAPVPVLARMWGVSDTRADDVCVSFKSMSLAKISTQTCDGRKQRGLNIHDLHLDFCRQSAKLSGREHVWHQRLLDGHMPLIGGVNDKIDGSDGRYGFSMLEFTPRPWWDDDVPNKDYIRRHLSRHLRGSDLDLELGSTVFDIRWISAQGEAGGVLGLQNDLNILQEVVERKAPSDGVGKTVVPVRVLSDVIVSMASDLSFGIRVVYQVLCGHLFGTSQNDPWIHLFLKRMEESIPKPFLEPTISFYRHPVDQKMNIDLRLPDQKGFAYLGTDFSQCDRYLAAGSNEDIVVFNLESKNRIQRMKGHTDTVTVVRFSADVRTLISGSLNGEIIVWDWAESELPLFVLKGHELSVTCLSLSGIPSKFFSGSSDGAVKKWDMTSGELCNGFDYGVEVECISICPTNEVIAIGTSCGRLRCRDLQSGRFVFEYSSVDECAISAVQFTAETLVCATSQGDATVWRCSDWERGATVNISEPVTHIAVYDDGQSVLLGSSTGDIRLWKTTEDRLSGYNICMGRPVNGLSFRKKGNEIIVGKKTGFAVAWTGPMQDPTVDFSAVRKNILYDFSLSADGARVAISTHDAMIRIWRCYTGELIVEYAAPAAGSHRLSLNRKGTKVASSSLNGSILVWNADTSPSDTDIPFTVGDSTVRCLSFSPDDRRLLICVDDEVQVWNLETKQKINQVPSFGSRDASFSSDGRFIVVGNVTRATIWNMAATEMVFDTAQESPQDLSVNEAKHVIKTCGSYGHRMCPAKLKEFGSFSPPLTVDNFFNFAAHLNWPSNMAFCERVFVVNFVGLLLVYKMRD